MSPRKAFVIASLALRQVLLDRVALFFIVVLPVLITLVIGLSVFGGARGFVIGTSSREAGPLGEALLARLEGSEAVTLRRYDDAEELRRAVRRGLVTAGVIVPAGYDAALRAGGPVTVEFVLDPKQGAPAGARTTVTAAVAAQSAAVRAARFASERTGIAFAETYALADARAAASRSVTVRSAVVATSTRSFPTGFSYPAAANVILFMFITSLAAAAGIIRAKQLGLAQRILATPTTPATLVAGQLLGRLSIALFQGLFIVGVGATVFGVRFGDPVGVAALVAAFALVATAVGVLMGTALRTPEQASAIAAPLGIALGMLGGTMWPLEVVGPAMRTAGHLTPHAWAMDAFVALIGRGAGLADVAGEILVLLGYAAVLLPIATWRLRAAVTR